MADARDAAAALERRLYGIPVGADEFIAAWAITDRAEARRVRESYEQSDCHEASEGDALGCYCHTCLRDGA